MVCGKGWRVAIVSSLHPHPAAVVPNPENDARESGALLTAEGVAALLAVPTSWIYAEARAGRIPHVRLGRYRRFRPEAIDAWITAAERGPRGR